jgi:hypothetical protein
MFIDDGLVSAGHGRALDRIVNSSSLAHGSNACTHSTSKPDAIEFRLDPTQGNLLHKAELREGRLVGEWSTETGQRGSWECAKNATN